MQRKLLNWGNTKLPKLLGKRETELKDGKEKSDIKQNILLSSENRVLKDAKILNQIAGEYATEKTIESVDNGENKIIYQKSVRRKNFRQK